MIGRPEPAEAAAYYFTYIDKVTGDDATSAIRNELDEALAFFPGISEDKSLYRYARGKMEYPANSEPCHRRRKDLRISRALVCARLRKPCAFVRPGCSGIRRQSRRDSLGRAHRGIPASAPCNHFALRAYALRRMDARGIASGNRVTVRALAFIIAGHLTHHVKILRRTIFVGRFPKANVVSARPIQANGFRHLRPW